MNYTFLFEDKYDCQMGFKPGKNHKNLSSSLPDDY